MQQKFKKKYRDQGRLKKILYDILETSSDSYKWLNVRRQIKT